MSAWTYCGNCGAGKDEPTFAEAVGAEEYRCDSCRHHLKTLKSGKDLLMDLNERIKRIEEHLGLGSL